MGQPERIQDWLEKYGEDEDAKERIEDCLTRNTVAMPIYSYQEIEPIDMRQMEKEIKGFRVPISYMYIDDKPQIYDYIKDRTRHKGNKIEHNFENVTSKDICIC